MREILFRGKRIDNGEWVEGQLLKYEDGRARICESHTDIFCYEKDESIIQTVAHMVAPSTVGQFTGLTDKNGKKIFEGDIIEWNAKEFGREYRELVEWDYKLLGFRQGDWGEWCKVIGNIHDNPELLRVEKDN